MLLNLDGGLCADDRAKLGGIETKTWEGVMLSFLRVELVQRRGRDAGFLGAPCMARAAKVL